LPGTAGGRRFDADGVVQMNQSYAFDPYLHALGSGAAQGPERGEIEPLGPGA
jgi:hypothetical protein